MQDISLKHASMPLVGVSCCRAKTDKHWFDMAGVKYTDALRRAGHVIPMLIPSAGAGAGDISSDTDADGIPLDALLDRIDGLVLTGSPSNIDPAYYDQDRLPEEELRDPARDQTILPLIRRALDRDMPVLAICRGIQELNVALGGTLHQRVHLLPGRADHRADPSLPVPDQYAPAHEVSLCDGGLLRGLAGRDRVAVNSLHEQGIDRLAPSLSIEARSDDDGIEAVRAADKLFCVGVQWHPEWLVAENPFSVALFAAFGAACRNYRERNR